LLEIAETPGGVLILYKEQAHNIARIVNLRLPALGQVEINDLKCDR